MKITYYEEIESKRAWRMSMCCRRCESHHFNIHHQLTPEIFNSWWVQCADCERVGPSAPNRSEALRRWREC
jgi:hypothetical protein